MPKASPLICNFNGGEASEFSKARADLQKYPNLCGNALNMHPKVQGGAGKRSGTMFTQPTKYSDKKAALLPFIYGRGQNYIIEAGDLYLRYFANRGQIDSTPGTPYETTTPWPATEVFSLDYTQSLDVLYLVSGLRHPSLLQRLTASTFSLAPFVMTGGPFQSQNVTTTKVYVAAGTGNTQVTADQDIFESGQVGGLFEMVIQDFSALKPWYAAATVSTSDKRRNAGKIYSAVAGGTTGGTGPTHDEGTVSDGVVDWLFEYKIRGYGRITSYIDLRNVTIDVIDRIPDELIGSANTTSRWSLGSFSDAAGWPEFIRFFSDRLTFEKQSMLYGSVVDGYDDFAALNSASEVVKDQAFIKPINSGKGNATAWIEVVDKTLIVGTGGDEFSVGKLSTSEAFGTGNIDGSQPTEFGSALGVRPVKVGKHLFFIDRTGVVLQDYFSRFDTVTDGFDADNQNLFSDHILYPKAKKIVFCAAPIPTLWALKDDGKLASLTFQKDQVVAGWAPHEIAGTGGADSPNWGFVEDIGVIPSAEGSWDELWMIVRRKKASGSLRRDVEYMQRPFDYETDPEQAFHVDAGLVLNNLQNTELTLTGDWTAKGNTGAAHSSASQFGLGDVGRRIEYRYRDLSVREKRRQWKTGIAEITAYSGPQDVDVSILLPFPAGATLAAMVWRLSVTTISGLGHLEGDSVGVYANAAVQKNQTVTGAQITLDAPAGYVAVGLNIYAVLAPLSPEAGTISGTAQGKLKRVLKFALRVWETVSLKYTKDGTSGPQIINFRDPAEDQAEAPLPFTGYVRDLTNESDWEAEAVINFISDEPGPCTILQYIPNVNTNEG